MWLQVKKYLGPREGVRGKEGLSPRAFIWSMTLLKHWFWTSDLQICERIYLIVLSHQVCSNVLGYPRKIIHHPIQNNYMGNRCLTFTLQVRKLKLLNSGNRILNSYLSDPKTSSLLSNPCYFSKKKVLSIAFWAEAPQTLLFMWITQDFCISTVVPGSALQ